LSSLLNTLELGRHAAYNAGMAQSDISEYLRSIGSRGGQSRAKKLSAEKRREIALKAAKASAKKRKKKTK
jgi:hypothetical protein